MILQPVVRKDIKYIQNYNATQHQEKKGPLADGPAASGAFVPALGKRTGTQTLGSNCQGSIPHSATS